MSPEKKTKMTTTEMTSLQSNQIPSLPEELLLIIIARVSRLYYPTLSLVSKSFRSLLASSELYRNRSLLGRTESCLYVCLMFPPDPNPRLFTLCRRPVKTLINDIGKKKRQKSSESGNILIPIPIPQSPRKCVVAFGSRIYAIGTEARSSIYYNNGVDEGAFSSTLSILDCRFHTWRDGPSMRVKRYNPAANVVDGKIYVAGCCKDWRSSDWMEVFDPKTQVWELVSCTLEQRRINDVYKSGVIDGKIYMFTNGMGVIYKPKEGRWKAIQASPSSYGMYGYSWCVIGNILYGYSYQNGIQWYNFKIGEWNTLKGYVRFPGLPEKSGFLIRLVDCGGKMAVLWDGFSPSGRNRMIWCGVIKLKKLNCDEIFGEVEWFDPVLTVPNSYQVKYAVFATV